MMPMPIMRNISQQNVVKKTNASTIRERKIIYEGSASPRELLETIALQAQAALKVRISNILVFKLSKSITSRVWKARNLPKILLLNLAKNKNGKLLTIPKGNRKKITTCREASLMKLRNFPLSVKDWSVLVFR